MSETPDDDGGEPQSWEGSKSMNYQPMPDLSASEYSARRENIRSRGILVPIVVDQDGNILDGHNRIAIAAELGIECPREVRHVQSADEAMDIAVELNCARRHLSQEQKRRLIAQEIERRPGDSDRAIARRVGCSPTTVGTVRNPSSDRDQGVQSGQLPSEERGQLAELEEQIRAALGDIRESFTHACLLALTAGCAPLEVLGAVTMARRGVEARTADPALFLPYDFAVFRPLTDWLMDSDATAAAERHARPADSATRRELLDAIGQFLRR